MLLYMLSSWRMYEMHPALSFKTGCYIGFAWASMIFFVKVGNCFKFVAFDFFLWID
jgi:hypothetical protein